ncbi:MAG: FAD-binding oxidoreductase [Alphaproteobacteria bacterium]|nr:FAD-binding oxidoreductase [Alphaproteobacteria bacterium]
MRITVLPRDDRPSGWYANLPDAPPARRLDGRQSADWVVVGAGFAGLAAARRLGELLPDKRIVLIEALRAGLGASGRNSGFIIDLPHNFDSKDMENRELNDRVTRLNRAAIDWLAGLVEKHQIQCQWRKRGKYQAAATPAGERANRPFAAWLAKMGLEHEVLGRDAVAARLGTAHFRQAVYTPNGILMQPAALVRGLAGSMPPNVDVFEESPVTDAEFGTPSRLTTPSGSITAPKIVLATNGFTDGWGFLRHRLIRIVACANLTGPLTDQQLATMGSDENWGVTPVDLGGATLRRTADNRILVRTYMRYGGNVRITATDHARARARGEASFRARWPQLGPPRFEHTWGGIVCLSRNHAPYWGELAPGVLAAVCCNGVGAAKCTIMGRAIAEWAAGVDSEIVRDMATLPKPDDHRLGPLIGAAVNLRLAWAQATAGAER